MEQEKPNPRRGRHHEHLRNEMRTKEQQDRLNELHMAMEYIVEMKLQEAYFTALENNDQESIEEIKDYLWTKN
jgi:hypothetical protein